MPSPLRSPLPLLLAAACLGLVPAVHQEASPEEPAGVQAVRAFVEAFNERDLDGLLALAHEEIEWASVSGTEVAVETRGRLELAAGLESYFEGCPTCRSELLWIEAAGTRVATHERASWTTTAGPKAQSSLAVYELEEGAIRRVYYYPAEAEADDGR